MKRLQLLLIFILSSGFVIGAKAELEDQGLNSIMGIIDKAITGINQQDDDPSVELDQADFQIAVDTITNLSRTLGTLSYSRLQCGEASVLAEFTQRVRQMPVDSRDSMRDAFQEGFDKSKEDSELMSQDECQRLTRSRVRDDQPIKANVETDERETSAEEESSAEAQAEENPLFRYLRIAEMSGQLAYKQKFCNGEAVFTRDYNQYLNSIPEDYKEKATTAYWKGYQRGKRLNKLLTKDKC